MKKIYQQPSVAIATFDCADILRTSSDLEFNVKDWLGMEVTQ